MLDTRTAPMLPSNLEEWFAKANIFTRRERLVADAFQTAGELALRRAAQDLSITIPRAASVKQSPTRVRLPGFKPPDKLPTRTINGWSLERNSIDVPSSCQYGEQPTEQRHPQTHTRSGFILGCNGVIYKIMYVTDTDMISDPLRTPQTPDPLEAMRAQPLDALFPEVMWDASVCIPTLAWDAEVRTTIDLHEKLVAFRRLSAGLPELAA